MNYSQPSCASHLPAAQGAVLKDADLVSRILLPFLNFTRFDGFKISYKIEKNGLDEMEFSMCQGKWSKSS